MRLRWYELLPLISYMTLLGRCRSCGSRIPLRYALVEGVTAALFLAAFAHYSGEWVTLFLTWALLSCLVVIVVYDLYHMIIPDEYALGLFGISLVIVTYGAFLGSAPLEASLAYIGTHLASGILGGLFFAALWFFSQGRAMGLGDAKLMVPLGIVLGPLGTFSAIVLAFWIGAGISLTFLALSRIFGTGKTRLPFLPRAIRMKSEVPFAPFLALGFLSVLLFHVDILSLFALSFPLF